LGYASACGGDEKTFHGFSGEILPVTEASHAVFLSYASQDAEAARKICEALRSAGIEVWFDQSELRGGDAWDQSIRKQIHDCTLFIPLISAHTDERTEGYFRLEWRLAVDRSLLIADDAAFLLPVIIDDTPDAIARVPDKFRTVQWTRLPAGEAPPAFCQRVSALLTGTAKPSRAQVHNAPDAAISRRTAVRKSVIAVLGMLLIVAIAAIAWRMMPRSPGALLQKVAAPAASVIPEHSIAVLPFVDLSAHKDQEYFSDGLAEDLLNLLSKVPGMQVAARSSAFSFKGHSTDVRTIGRQLGVAHVLEGSVRKVGNHLRVTAQLERADNGYQIWSETYDRELGDVFRIQDEISAAVVKAMKVSLLGAATPRSTGTQSPGTYLVFLQGRAKMSTNRMADIREAADDFARVVRLDPNYAPAYVELATAKLQRAEFEITENRQAAFDAAAGEAKLLIEQALVLDPKNAQAYVERGYLRAFHDPAGAEKDLRRGIELNPNSARGYVGLARMLYEDPARRGEALAMIERAHQLDPLEPEYEVLKAILLINGLGRFRDADVMLVDFVARYPLYQEGLVRLSDVRRFEGNYADAIMYGEQALKLDPLHEWARQELIRNYSDVADPGAARQVADEAPHRLPVRRLRLLIAEGNWHQAAEVSYAALADGSMTSNSEPIAVFALRMEARRTHDFGRARVVFERMCGVTWSAGGIPTLPTQTGFAFASVALADMLIQSGERARGERLLRASVADMDHVVHDFKRSELWYVIDKATALALLGDRKAALAALHKAVDEGYITTWTLIPLDPAFDMLRGDAEFQGLMRAIQAKVVHERQILDRMRADGRVPVRSGSATAGPPAARAPARTP
jgi:TolB-like protein/Tfp pilus assembly protein PilF